VHIQVEYDDHGHITAVIGGVGIHRRDGEEGRLGRFSRTGHHVIEVDSDEVSHERDFSGLRRLVNGYRVAGHPDAPKLVGRAQSS
jgi:hypothetical protein